MIVAGQVNIERVAEVSAPLAARIAMVTRASYLAGDLARGLPPADGSVETGGQVQADLAAGWLLWLATAGGNCVGTVRGIAAHDGAWVVRRLCVAPQARGMGVGLRLLRAVESAALAGGSRSVELDAVVERGTPAFYGTAGYRVTRHFAAPDKPLSEVRMRRPTAERPRRLRYPADIDAGPSSGILVSWWAVAAGTACLLGPAEPDLAAVLASHQQDVASACGPVAGLLGIDCWAGASGASAGSLRADIGALAKRRAPAGVACFDRAAVAIPAFAQPRLVRSRLLAWWRMPAARTQQDRG
jgi:GNAT superfamily N-acetyltransferase